MNEYATSEKINYLENYREKTLLLKVSGAEIRRPEFFEFARQVLELKREGVRFVLIFGGGEQIDEEWVSRHPHTTRPKKNGVGITSGLVLKDAAMPAYESIRLRLQEILGAHTMLSPEQVGASIKDYEKYGYVGSAEWVKGLDTEDNLVSLGFMGKQGEQMLNINADELIRAVLLIRPVEEVVLLTCSGGVLNKKGEIVSELNKMDIGDILNGCHKDIQVTGGMNKKLNEIHRLLDIVSRVAIIRAQDLKRELLREEGAGTLCTRF